MHSIRALLPQMLLLVPGKLHQVYKQKRIRYGELRKLCQHFGVIFANC